MDEDTKLLLQMWRVQVMENHRLAGVSDHLQSQEAGLLRRIADLEHRLAGVLELRELRDAGKRTDAGGADADWRRAGRGRRRDPDSSD